MKNILLLLSIILVTFVVYSCSSADASTPATPKPTDQDIVNNLADLGFGKHSTMKVKNDILNKYGLPFHTDQELNQLTSSSGLICAPVSRYIADVPETSAKEIIANYNKVKDIKHYCACGFMGTWREATDDDKGLMIVAPANHFIPGTTDFSKLDPIVLIKVDGGWIELARW